jgi:hypothetical protein
MPSFVFFSFAVIGFLLTEAPLSFHPLFDTGDRDIGPAIRHLDEVRASSPIFFEILTVTIGVFELLRALKGWEVFTGQKLKDDYYPGDIGTCFCSSGTCLAIVDRIADTFICSFNSQASILLD